MSIKETLQTQRRVLLDLTYRNRLLNVPNRKSSRSINVFDELSFELFRILVVERKEMTFAPIRKGSGDVEEVSEEEMLLDEEAIMLPQPEDDQVDSRGISNRHADNKLQTKLTSEHLQKRLLEMLYDAQTMIEEQGVNILYLALGQLRYYDPSATTEEKVAPLVLVPVKIERKSARDRFVLKWTEEDPTENLSLSEKLRVDFKLRLPDFPGLDAFDLQEYFAAIRNSTANQVKWQVEENNVQLGFFSFAKLLMFRDLDPAGWPAGAAIDTHPLIVGLLGEGFAGADHEFGAGESLDQMLPVAVTRHVMDCDSSQALAIEAIRRGQNMVIQGPPGTGKSQTIANLIATAVSDGKTVLFVAEKMAALEVVKRRLENVGLGSLCLELHSNKSNKKQVLEELARTLQIGKPTHLDVSGPVERLSLLRTQLNQHAEQLHRPAGAAGLTPYRILGELSKRTPGVERPDYKLAGANSWSLQEAQDLSRTLSEVCRLMAEVSDPRSNPWRGVQHEPTLRPMAETLIVGIKELSISLAEVHAAGINIGSTLGIHAPTTISELQQQCKIANELAKAPSFDRATIASGVWNAGVDSLREAVKQGKRLSEIVSRRGSEVLEIAWETDWAAQRLVISGQGKSWFRWMNSAYRQALAQVRSVVRGDFPKAYGARLALLDDLIAGNRAQKSIGALGSMAKSAFGSIWRDRQTDWALAESILGWVDGQSGQAPGFDLRKLASELRDPDALPLAATRGSSAANRCLQLCTTVSDSLQLDCQIAFSTASLHQVELTELEDRCSIWGRDLDGLMKWLEYAETERVARARGLGDVIDYLLQSKDRQLVAIDQFWVAYYLEMLSTAIATYPELAKFDGRRHDSLVDQFRRLDKERIQLAQFETALAHYNSVPKGGGSLGAIGILKGEIAKKRSHMAIRKLIKHCGSPIQATKPVFMMSPLSIAQFLEPGAVEFDLLVIDEASQVQPVDALGAVARSRQVVVVGDDKQLPPTAFFSKLVDEGIADELEEVGAQAKDLESILSLCSAKGLPSKMLQWHYRSRHESLIAVSNKEFYEGKLFIVPSPDKERNSLGLKLHYLPEGRFDRGSSQKNPVEAAAITQVVLEHARSRPELTLGVGAMSMRQRQAISDELELARRNYPELDQFFSAHPHEPFFIKNLENIQGDERDVILISIGYAKAKNDDKLYQNFGPLLLDGGHRRLNVLITRARERCEVFTSILPDEIRIDERSKHGLIALKTFLKYAQTGDLGVPIFTGHGVDSPFEEAVQVALSKFDLTIDNQVGVAGFFIDLAVVDPESPGRYLLGIECDGASYHSAPSARDRDRLRQEILEANGWSIHRIWSTDWFQNPNAEMKRLLAAVAKAKLRVRPNRQERLASTTTISRELELPLGGRTASFGKPYVEANFTPGQLEIAPHLVSIGSMAFTVEKIVAAEGPIHIDEIVARVRDLWGLGRAGSRIQEAVERATEHLARSGKVLGEANCYCIPGQTIEVRDRSNANSKSLRRPECLPPQEIREAILTLVKEALGVGADELPVAVSRTLGFQATSQQLRDRISPQILALIQDGRLIQESGYLRASSKNRAADPE